MRKSSKKLPEGVFAEGIRVPDALGRWDFPGDHPGGPRPARIMRIDCAGRESAMSRRLISTGSPFEKTFGYSRAVVDGDFAFVSGTTGYDYATMKMPGSVEEQTRNCFATIAAVLA